MRSPVEDAKAAGPGLEGCEHQYGAAARGGSDGGSAIVAGERFVFAVAVLASAPKIGPESVAGQVFDAVEAGQVEVLADERSRDVKAKLSRDHELIYPPIQEFWDAAVSGTS